MIERYPIENGFPKASSNLMNEGVCMRQLNQQRCKNGQDVVGS